MSCYSHNDFAATLMSTELEEEKTFLSLHPVKEEEKNLEKHAEHALSDEILEVFTKNLIVRDDAIH